MHQRRVNIGYRGISTASLPTLVYVIGSRPAAFSALQHYNRLGMSAHDSMVLDPPPEHSRDVPQGAFNRRASRGHLALGQDPQAD